jgi:DNA-binding MarR family transcriptional regulator
MKPTMPKEAVVTAWVRLIRAQNTALSTVETALKCRGLPQLSWYDALLELDRVGDKGMRPFELERALLLPQYGLSRLLERIERAGYIERRRCDEDGRGQVVAITAEGLAMRKRMWPILAAAIEEAVGARLTDREAEQLGDLLGKLINERQSESC